MYMFHNNNEVNQLSYAFIAKKKYGYENGTSYY